MNNSKEENKSFLSLIAILIIFAIACMLIGASIYKMILEVEENTKEKESKTIEAPIDETRDEYLADIEYYLANIDKNLESMMHAQTHDLGYIEGQLEGIAKILKKK